MVQADTVVPGMYNPLAFDRYAYVLDSPLGRIDPSGNDSVCGYSYSDPECDGKDEGIDQLIPGSDNPNYGNDFQYHKYPRIDIPADILDQIATIIYAETNGKYPVWAMVLMIWATFNAYVDPAIDIYTAALEDLRIALHLDTHDQIEIAELATKIYKSMGSRIWQNIRSLVETVYGYWKAGLPDPTKGSTQYSVAGALVRKDLNGNSQTFDSYYDLLSWLYANFVQHAEWYDDFSFYLSVPFTWDPKYDRTGILVLGNHNCVTVSNCGLPGWNPKHGPK